jgi:serine/threonine protein kinase
MFRGGCVNGARIVLRGTEWHYDPSRKLGKPGDYLGYVFEGTNGQGQRVAVKKIKFFNIAALHRELAIVDELVGRDLVHVLPVLDWGQDLGSGDYFIIMPRAERNLAEELELRTAPMPTADAASILLQVASGLAELPGIVHRDIKPENVLLHEGKWKITDFGNARLLITPTLKKGKEGGTPEYAAPEQWLGENPTHATDVYALGCLAHKLLRGAVPFDGPNWRDGHLKGTPPDVPQSPPQLRGLISAMLRKKQNVRPSLKRILAVLNEVASNPPAGSNE